MPSLAEAIKEATHLMEKSDDEIHIFEMDSWRHICIIWFGNTIKQMDKTLRELLAHQLGELMPNYCIHTDIIALLHAIEKECARTCNYAKGHGDQLNYCMHIYDHEAYLFPFAWAYGSSRQEIGLGGCAAIYMNLCYLVAVFFDHLSIKDDSLLHKTLFMTLQLVEFIALL
jgi:hypothetical protein